jgi:hypothetical protein
MFRKLTIADKRSKLIKSLFDLVIIVSILIIIGLVAGCSMAQDEPPLAMGRGNAKGLARSTELQDINSNEGIITYKVQYYNPNYTSYALISFSTRALKQETFPGKWIVVYEYEKKIDEIYQLPSKIRIYKDAGNEQKGKLINIYTKERPVGNGIILYRDKNDKEKTIDSIYFRVMPGR